MSTKIKSKWIESGAILATHMSASAVNEVVVTSDLLAFTGITITDNRNIKDALQDLETAHELSDGKVSDLVTLSGVAVNSIDLGVFTGAIIPDTSTIKASLQALETDVETRALDSSVIKKDGTVAFTADQAMGGFKLTGLAAPIGNNDAARKIDIDNSIAGIQSKDAAQLASTANLTLTGEQTIDGVLSSASRILVKDQTIASENGIYTTGAGGWVRTLDADGTPANEVQGGMLVFVTEGTTNINTSFRLTGTGNVIVGTDAQNFIVYSRAEATSASLGILKSGLDFQLADSAVNASGIKVLSGAITLENLGAFFTTGLAEGTNLYFTEARVRSTVLTGLDVLTNGTVAPTSSVLAGMGFLQANQADLTTLSGVAQGAVDLGIFTGVTIANNSDLKTALQALETSQESSGAEVTALVSLTGVASLANDLGTFTGLTIPDTSTVKAALQALETAVEGASSQVEACDEFVLIASDITNKYVDLTSVPSNANCVQLFVDGGPKQRYAVDFSIITNGSVVKRLIWDSADLGVSTGMLADLAIGDVLMVSYAV